jgi:hypothetical protein
MQRKRLVAPGEIRRRPLLLPAVAALVLIVSFTTSCPGPGANNNNGVVTTQSSPTTTASPSPTQGLTPPPPPPPLDTDDRPIIISGGSLDLDFNSLYYKASGGSFRSSNNRITTLRVYDDDATDAAVGLCTVNFGGASDITIAYSIAGGGGSGTIRVVSATGPAGNTVDLTFNTTQLPRRNPNSNKHYNKKASIDSITYTGGSPATCDLGSKKKVTIELEGTPVACSMTTPSPSPSPTATP